LQWWQLLGIKPEVASIISKAEQLVSFQHRSIEEVSLYNQARVLKAFQDEKVTEEHFSPGEGYGYNDSGREKLESLFARIFKGEEAVVRPQFVSGTHTLFTCLLGLLRPGERLISVTGPPYDTLMTTITGFSAGSDSREGHLNDWGISFLYLNTEEFIHYHNEDHLRRLLQKPTKAVFIQRSRGYSPHRRSLTVSEIRTLVNRIRLFNPGVAVLVDNCYGEFVEKEEPLQAGADLIAGSLIKNPGGGLAPTGGYVVGKKKYIDRVSNMLSAPGLGKELGAFLCSKRPFFQGLFMAPHLSGQALKGAVTMAAALELAGYNVEPGSSEERGDIVQAVRLKSEEELQKVCCAVQNFSPVNSHLVPVAGRTAGYHDLVYMAAGTFVQGASSEFSADAPLREPFNAYLQGGLSYEHVLAGTASVLQVLLYGD